MTKKRPFYLHPAFFALGLVLLIVCSIGLGKLYYFTMKTVATYSIATEAAAATAAPEGLPTNIDPSNPLDLVTGLLQAVEKGHWPLAVGLIIMLMTALIDLVFKRKIPKRAMPWIAIGLSMAAQGALYLSMGKDWPYAIVGGAVTGFIAAGGYSALGRYVPGIKKPAKQEPTKQEPADQEPADQEPAQ
jgi:hypothetical protein